VENLPRLRDLVDQELTALRQRMQRAEEAWVRDPHDAWWRQAFPLHLHTSSFLTRAHDLHRLRWMLLDPADGKVTAEVIGFLDGLAAASALPRVQLEPMIAGALAAKPTPAGKRWTDGLAKLSPRARELGRKALEDLRAVVPDLPDGSLAADWTYL